LYLSARLLQSIDIEWQSGELIMFTSDPRTRLRALAGFLLVLIVAAPAAMAEVAIRIQWKLDGPLDQLQAAVKKGAALQKRINPEVRHELWVDEIHGASGGGASLVVFYRDMEHYAQATARENADPEWQAFLQSFPAKQFPTTYVGMMNVPVSNMGSAAADGEVLNIFGFDLKDDAAGLAELVQKAMSIQKKAGIPAQLALVVSTLSGDDRGAAVLARYKSLSDFASSTEKLAANAEWQSFLATFPADRYPLVYRGLSRSVGIE
jgi:hypothetical protein